MLHSLRSPRLIALMCVFCIGSLLIVPAAHAGGVVGNGTPASCSEAAFTAALAGGGQVTFNCGPNPHTIVLTGARDIAANTVIDGGGLITLSGGTTTRLFTVKAANNAHLTVRNLTLRDAGGPAAGAIYVEQSGGNRGFFTAVNVSFHDNRSGGIWSRGTVTIDQGTFDSHAAPAISNETTGVLSVQHSTFSNNVTINDDGGAIFNQGQATISHSTFTGNGTSTSGSARSFDGAGLYNDGEATITHTYVVPKWFGVCPGLPLYVTVTCHLPNAGRAGVLYCFVIGIGEDFDRARGLC